MAKGNLCPDEETLADFLEGRLTDARRRAIDTHLTQCAVCREQVAVCAEVMALQPTADAAPAVSEHLIRKTLNRVAETRRPRHGPVMTRTRRLISRGLASMERLAGWSTTVPVAVRGGADVTIPIIHRRKTFGEFDFAIDLERTGASQTTIRVAIDAPQTITGRLRVALHQGERELASAGMGPAPVVFEDIPFGTYSLAFVHDGHQLGIYPFEVVDTGDGDEPERTGDHHG